MLKDKLQIFLITYNRKNLLKNTFNQIFAENSPIRNFDITILDNASTDGTSELIEDYIKEFPNIKHIRNQNNIGGNANICRAFELSAFCGKEYAWILCDDDYYDFSNWKEVEDSIEKKTDIICLSDYAFPSPEDKNNRAYQLFQLTFVPSILYRTDFITDNVLHNMYDSICNMFQQLCLVIKAINIGGDIHVLSKPIVMNGLFVNKQSYDLSLTRGADFDFMTERRKEMLWVTGFVNVLTLLDKKDLISECLEVSLPSKWIYKSWDNFYRIMVNRYLNIQKFNYFYEIFKFLNPRRKFETFTYIFINFARILKRVIKIKY